MGGRKTRGTSATASISIRPGRMSITPSSTRATATASSMPACTGPAPTCCPIRSCDGLVASAEPATPPLLLYPVRGIRRKNLGEFLLLTALAPEGTRFAVTRAPLNPAAKPVHDDWRRFARECAIAGRVRRGGPARPRRPRRTSFESWCHTRPTSSPPRSPRDSAWHSSNPSPVASRC